MERACNDYGQFGDWCMQGVCFVTRMKRNTKFSVIEKRTPPARRHILSDELIVLTGDRADRCPDTLRLVRAIDPGTGDIVDLLTKNLELEASCHQRYLP